MKKLKNSLFNLVMIAITLVSTFSTLNVKAYTTQDTLYQDDNYKWWVAIYNRANTHMVATQESMLRRASDNKPVYCIQAPIQFNNGSAVNGIVDTNTMVSMSGLSAEQVERIKLIAYYGYGYGNHNSPEWYYATQLLIWANVNPGYVYAIADGDYSLTPSTRYDGYYNEINSLVNNHTTAPSFARQTFEMKNGETLTINDTNNVLSKFYEGVETDDYKTTIDRNKLIISAKKGYEGTINLNVKSNDNPPMLYEGANQLCMSAGDPVMMMARLNIIVRTPFEGYKVYGDKKAGTYRPEKDAEFEIYNNSTNELLTTLTSDEAGMIKYDFRLGEYRIHQTKGKKGYTLIEDYILTIDESNLKEIIYFQNNAIKGSLDFTKTDISESKPLPNTLIEIYNADTDELVYSERTDDNGKVVIKNIKYGRYFIIEKDAPEGYQLNPEKMYFEIKEDGEIVKATMKDEIITGTLEFSKVDFSTAEPLPNTLIEIYNADTEELVYSERTDENGKIVIENIEYGRYFIIEKDAPEGYQLNPEKMYFEIKENGEIVKATMKDEKIVEVPDTSKNEFPVFETITIIISLSGLGILMYAKKRKKK